MQRRAGSGFAHTATGTLTRQRQRGTRVWNVLAVMALMLKRLRGEFGFGLGAVRKVTMRPALQGHMLASGWTVGW